MQHKHLALVALMACAGASAEAAPSKDFANAIDVFSAVCLPGAPAMPKSGQAFRMYGYKIATKDPGMFANDNGGFAGVGKSSI
ncbi:MAG: hypothetical protein ACRCS0_16130, partial [Albidovulum sp.]